MFEVFGLLDFLIFCFFGFWDFSFSVSFLKLKRFKSIQKIEKYSKD